MKMMLIVLLSTLGSSAAWSLSCTQYTSPSQAYPLYCHGGRFAIEMDMEMVGGGSNGNQVIPPSPQINVTTPFTKGTQAAGLAGANVPAGACAWTDRAFNAQEPDTLTTFVDDGDGSKTIWQSLSACMQNSNCVFEVCAYNQNNAIHIYPFNAVLLNVN